MAKKVITLGEIMLRLAPEGYYRFVQADTFGATYGGGEANVAVSMANYGFDAKFVTKLPAHEIGQAAVNALRKYGVDTSYIARGGDRVGIYFLEKGASQRPSKVIYDRAGSSMATASQADFNWDEIFAGAEWFHFTGITPALNDEVAAICLDACKAAKAAGFLAKTACKMGAHKKGKFFQKMALGLYGKALGEDESENGWISYNKENVKAYDENPLDGFVFSNNGFLNLFLLMDETYNKKGWQVKHPSLPILFIAGADDPCIGSKKQYAQAMTTLKKRGYNQVRGMLFLNRRHEILNEDDVEKVYDAVLHFLEQHSKKR